MNISFGLFFEFQVITNVCSIKTHQREGDEVYSTISLQPVPPSHPSTHPFTAYYNDVTGALHSTKIYILPFLQRTQLKHED
ncbi:hypothetical protein J6590_058614 [Homalodisca vitripennis]|nr:hypothetical protein J6590_058614 [Homalodisca vitripennis]